MDFLTFLQMSRLCIRPSWLSAAAPFKSHQSNNATDPFSSSPFTNNFKPFVSIRKIAASSGYWDTFWAVCKAFGSRTNDRKEEDDEKVKKKRVDLETRG
jgi:hypothetical protein